jgi:flagellar biosynthesis protein FliP
VSDYFVRFSIHLIPSLKPEDWPNPVLHETVLRAESFQKLKDELNKYLYSFVRQSGVVTMVETDKPLQENLETMDLRRYVPMHMVAYISHKTTKLVADVPNGEDPIEWIN